MSVDTILDRSIVNASTPLFAFSRGGIPEIAINGVGFFKTQARDVGVDFDVYDPSVIIVARSLLKPWQFLAADIAFDAEETFWILGLSSHNAEERHLKQLSHLAEVAGAGEVHRHAGAADGLDGVRCVGALPVLLLLVLLGHAATLISLAVSGPVHLRPHADVAERVLGAAMRAVRPAGSAPLLPRKAGKSFGVGVLYFLIGLVLLFELMPFYFIFVTAFKTKLQIQQIQRV